MSKKGINKKDTIRKVDELFSKACHAARKNPELAKDYVKKARRTAMRFNLKLPREIRKKFCRNCYNLFASDNYKTRIRHDYLVLECLNCKSIQRYKVK